MSLIKSNLTVIFILFFAQTVLAQPAINEQPMSDDLLDSNSVLWKVTGNGMQQPSYVFGSWHLLCRNEIIFKNKVKLAISQSEQLLIQNFITYLSADDYYERQAEDARINRGKPIYKLDNRKQRKKLLKLINKDLDLKVDHAKRVMPIVKRMTPMEVYFSSMHSFIDDCDGLGSFDGLLYDHFHKKGAPVGSVNDRKTFMESLMDSGFVNTDSLISYLEDIESQKALVEKMKLSYYRDEKISTLKQLYRIFLTNDFTDDSLIEQHILAINVQPWVGVMVDWIKVKPTFVSVNATYLMGEKGIIETLRLRGFTVEPVR